MSSFNIMSVAIWYYNNQFFLCRTPTFSCNSDTSTQCRFVVRLHFVSVFNFQNFKSSICSFILRISCTLLTGFHYLLHNLSQMDSSMEHRLHPGIVKFFNNVVMPLLLWFSLSSGKFRRKPCTNTFKDSDDPWAI